MSIFSAERFVRQHGWEALKRFKRRCNDGASLAILAQEFGMSVPTVSRLRNTLFQQRWVLREDVESFINFRISYYKEQINEHAELLQEDAEVLRGDNGADREPVTVERRPAKRHGAKIRTVLR